MGSNQNKEKNNKKEDNFYCGTGMNYESQKLKYKYEIHYLENKIYNILKEIEADGKKFEKNKIFNYTKRIYHIYLNKGKTLAKSELEKLIIPEEKDFPKFQQWLEDVFLVFEVALEFDIPEMKLGRKAALDEWLGDEEIIDFTPSNKWFRCKDAKLFPYM
jgi:hypothetical protein